jgi:glycerophosphoryl diester phosphodiesterase
MNIEIKTTTALDTDEEVREFASKLIGIIHEYNLNDTVIVQSFDVRALKYVKEIDSTIKTSYLLEDKLPAIDELIKTSKQLHVQIISPYYTLLKRPIVAQLQENGFEVVPWTVNDINEIKILIGYGVNGIITSYPKQMKDYISTM